MATCHGLPACCPGRRVVLGCRGQVPALRLPVRPHGASRALPGLHRQRRGHAVVLMPVRRGPAGGGCGAASRMRSTTGRAGGGTSTPNASTPAGNSAPGRATRPGARPPRRSRTGRDPQGPWRNLWTHDGPRRCGLSVGGHRRYCSEADLAQAGLDVFEVHHRDELDLGAELHEEWLHDLGDVGRLLEIKDDEGGAAAVLRTEVRGLRVQGAKVSSVISPRRLSMLARLPFAMSICAVNRTRMSHPFLSVLRHLCAVSPRLIGPRRDRPAGGSIGDRR